MSILDFRKFLAPAIVAVASMTASSHALGDLKVGSPAPDISVANWAQGGPVNLNSAGKTFVVEFWATWCGPCKRAIPHINELYQKYRSRGLVVVGISDEPLSKVKPFVTQMGPTMTYNVGCDDERKTSTAWMEAAGQSGIPCAFIVREGKILWIGNPLDERFDSVLITALTGRYNPELTRSAKPTLDAANAAIRVKNYKDALKHFDAVIALDPAFFGDVAVRKYKLLAVDANDPTSAKAWGEKMLEVYARDAQTLGELALAISKDDSIKTRDFELAVRMADAAGAVAPKGDAATLALRAEVLACAGKFAEAKELQYEAWMSASSSEKAEYKRLLDNYSKQAAKAKAGT